MSGFKVEAAANLRLDEIAEYTRRIWGERQAETYIDGLFGEFQAIADKPVPWASAPTILGIDGFRRAYLSHFIYWKVMGDGQIAIMTILHQRMQQAQQLRGADLDWS